MFHPRFLVIFCQKSGTLRVLGNSLEQASFETRAGMCLRNILPEEYISTSSSNLKRLFIKYAYSQVFKTVVSKKKGTLQA